MSGIKLHIIVDTLGLPHAIHVTCANVTDRKGALDMISLHLKDLSSVSKFLVYGGDSGDNFVDTVEEIHGADVEVVKKTNFINSVYCLNVSLLSVHVSSLEKNLRLWKNCERKLQSSL